MRKVYVTLGLIASLITSGIQLQAAPPANWERISQQQIPSGLQPNLFAKEYDLFRLNRESLFTLLSSAGTDPESAITVTIPIGDERQTLKVWRDDVLAPELQAQYPDIVSFTGFDPANQSITAKLDFNMYGFHAMVFNAEKGTYIIDPYSLRSGDYYIGVFQKDLDRSHYASGVCGFNDDMIPNPTGSGVQIGGKDLNAQDPSERGQFERPHGNVKRTYRLALACTGEWANMITGGFPSVPGIMGIMNTIINRCNGVFQRELGVKMVLIANNNEVIYIDPASDPFACNANNDCLIDENQVNMNLEFPAGAGYDIGHIFNTAGGGLAQLQSVCDNTGKARGVSGVMSDADIMVVVHEMGHQMGSTHTFNSDQGGCAGNGTAATAYEPGSGTSIMSYNGLCGADNVASPTTNYYHVASLDMIRDYIVDGEGAGCGTTESGFTPVTIMSLGQSHNIPKNTAFELIADPATASEPDPEITYNWEQYDLGHNTEMENASGGWDSGPTFMSKDPSLKRDHQYPDNALVAANTYADVGQRLSTVERTLTFKLTTRSIFEGWGTFNFSDDVVTVNVVACNQFRVTHPNAAALYEVGSPLEVKWDTTQTRQEPILCGFVNIYMSLDGGITFPYIVVTNAPNTGSCTFATPDVYSDNVRFKVKASGNVFYDMNKTSVQIHGNPSSTDPVAGVLGALQVYPNPASHTLYVKNSYLVRQPLQAALFNVSGQVVFKGAFTQDLSIDITPLAKGNYFLQVLDPESGKTKTEKVSIR